MSNIIEMKWIDVQDRLPDGNGQVIAWAPKGERKIQNLMAQCDYIDGCFYFMFYRTLINGVTHWMELPPPPIDEREE